MEGIPKVIRLVGVGVDTDSIIARYLGRPFDYTDELCGGTISRDMQGTKG